MIFLLKTLPLAENSHMFIYACSFNVFAANQRIHIHKLLPNRLFLWIDRSCSWGRLNATQKTYCSEITSKAKLQSQCRHVVAVLVRTEWHTSFICCVPLLYLLFLLWLTFFSLKLSVSVQVQLNVVTRTRFRRSSPGAFYSSEFFCNFLLDYPIFHSLSGRKVHAGQSRMRISWSMTLIYVSFLALWCLFYAHASW